MSRFKVKEIEQIVPRDDTAAVAIRVDKYPSEEYAEAMQAAIEAQFDRPMLVVFLKKHEEIAQLSLEQMSAHGWVKYDPEMMSNWKRNQSEPTQFAIPDEELPDLPESPDGDPVH
jgi:hypothetical protein